MNDHSATTNTEQKKRGRPSETPLQRLKRLEHETALARQAVEEADRLRLATIGSAVLAEANTNDKFMDQLRGILKTHVSTKAGKAAIAGMT